MVFLQSYTYELICGISLSVRYGLFSTLVPESSRMSLTTAVIKEKEIWTWVRQTRALGWQNLSSDARRKEKTYTVSCGVGPVGCLMEC